jgi:hypothetical protein
MGSRIESIKPPLVGAAPEDVAPPVVTGPAEGVVSSRLSSVGDACDAEVESVAPNPSGAVRDEGSEVVKASPTGVPPVVEASEAPITPNPPSLGALVAELEPVVESSLPPSRSVRPSSKPCLVVVADDDEPDVELTGGASSCFFTTRGK